MAGGLHPPYSIVQEWKLKSNPDDPSDIHGWELPVTVVVFFCLALTALLARLYATIKGHRRCLALEDYVIIAAFIPLIGLNIALILGARLYGFDRHAWDLTEDMVVSSRKIILVVDFLFILSTGLIKIAILIFYYGLADRTISPWFRTSVQFFVASVSIYIVVSIALIFSICQPFNAFWDSLLPEWLYNPKNVQGRDWHCGNEGRAILATSAVSVVQDFIVCFLPLMLIWRLTLPRRQKVCAMAIFLVGLLVCVIGCMRCYYSQYIYFNTYDVTWYAEYALLFTGIEANLAVCCASAPALRLFFQNYFASPVKNLATKHLPSSKRNVQRTTSHKHREGCPRVCTARRRPYRSVSRTFASIDEGDEENMVSPEIEPIKIQITEEFGIVSNHASPRESVFGDVGMQAVDTPDDMDCIRRVNTRTPDFSIIMPTSVEAPWIDSSPSSVAVTLPSPTQSPRKSRFFSPRSTSRLQRDQCEEEASSGSMRGRRFSSMPAVTYSFDVQTVPREEKRDSRHSFPEVEEARRSLRCW